MDNIDYGTRAALISAALKRAREQEATPMPQMQMMGRFAAGPTGGDIFNTGVQRALGGYSAGRREEELTALNNEQMGKFADLSQQLSQPGSVDYSDPASLSADNARRMGLASQMSQLSLPQAQKVAQDYLQKGVSFPDTMAQLQMRQIEARDRDAQRKQEKDRFDQLYRLTAAQQLKVAEEAARTRGIGMVETVDANGNKVSQVYNKADLTPGQTFAKPADKPSSAAEKGINASQALKDKANSAIALLKSNPDAVGWKTLIPNMFLQRMYPEGVPARMKTGELSAEKAHELYGAAFTAAEMARAGKFLPQDGDDYDTTIIKLEGMRDIAAEAEARWAKTHKTAPSATIPGGMGSGAPSATIPGGMGSGAPGSTNPQDIANFEQHYQTLQPGQRYIDPNGVPRIKGGQ